MNCQSARTVSTLALLVTFGCQTPSGTADDAATAPHDAATSPDAHSAPDAATTRDAATSPDAPPIADAGNDAFVPTDSSSPDAFIGPDAFAPPDAYVAPPVRPNPGDIFITEIQAAPAGYADDSLAEWVEVHNPSTTVTYELNGCVFSDKPTDDDHTITHSLLLPPGGYLVLSSTTFTVALNGFVSDEVYGAAGTGLSGTGDAPTIKCGGVVIDTVDYNQASFADPDAMEGHTLQLSPGSLSATANDDGTHWCFSTHVFFTSIGMDNTGSPRTANETCP